MGFAAGTRSELLAATALWTLRDRLGAIGALNRIALGALCASFAFTAALDLLIGGLNAPFELFVAAPAATVLTLRSRAGTGVRATLGGLAVLWWLAVGLVTFVPDARILGTGGYRVFGVVAYVAVGLLWVTLGVVLLRRIPSGR